MPTDYKNQGSKQGGSDPNVLKIKEVNKVRPLDNVVAQWRQHGIQHPSDSEQFTSVVCPGPRSCPLCRKPVDANGNQRFPVSRRRAANMWDYATSSVKVLIGGPRIFDEFKAVALVGIEPASCDWTITKEGQGKNTKYNVIRHDAASSGTPQVSPEMLHSVAKYEDPDAVETIFEKLEQFGIDYDALEVPSYTVDQALAYRMPYTKHRGETIEQVLSTDDGLSFAEWLHGTKLEQGQLGDPTFLALQVALENRERVPPLEEALQLLPEPRPGIESPPEQLSAQRTGAGELAPSAANMQKLIAPDGSEVMVPPTAVEHMLKGGFKRPEPQTPVDADAPTLVLIGGQRVQLPRQQALKLIEAGTAQQIEEPADPEPPLPLPDEEVQVTIHGVTVPMRFVEAREIVENPTASAEFADEAVAQAHQRAQGGNRARVDPTPSPAPANASTGSAEPESSDSSTASAPDPDKPHVCEQCGAGYKTAGGLTSHRNRVHAAQVEPQPSAVPMANDGAGNLLAQVKHRISHADYAKDFTQLLRIFEEATGETNFANMDQEQLRKLNAKLDELEAQP